MATTRVTALTTGNTNDNRVMSASNKLPFLSFIITINIEMDRKEKNWPRLANSLQLSVVRRSVTNGYLIPIVF